MTCRVCDGHYGDNGQPQAVPRELPSTVLVTDVARDPEWVRNMWKLHGPQPYDPRVGVGRG